MINSIVKGKAGEREFAEFLRDRGLTARRSQQYMGTADSADVLCKELEDVHFEVKRTERFNCYEAIEQAVSDSAPWHCPVVAHRRNRGEWLAVLRMDDLLQLLGHPLSQQPACEPPGASPEVSADKPGV